MSIHQHLVSPITCIQFDNGVFGMMDRDSFMRVCIHLSFFIAKYRLCLIWIHTWSVFSATHTDSSHRHCSLPHASAIFPQLLSHLSRPLTEASQRERSAWHPDKSAAQKATAGVQQRQSLIPLLAHTHVSSPPLFLAPLFFCGLFRVLF